jgi:hypothetical protein
MSTRYETVASLKEKHAKVHEEKILCLDPRELANFLGVSIGRGDELMREKDFPSVRISTRRWIVTAKALEGWLEQQSHKK